jgi:RecA/RadA recombinase
MTKTQKPALPKEVLDCFKSIDKLNSDSTLLSENSLSTVTDWHDTGCMALNAILSGSLYGGVADSRVTGFVGPSATGKTYIVNKILAIAQQEKGLIPVIFDTEGAIDEGSTRGVGLDPSRVKYVPVDTVEDCRNQLCQFMDDIKAAGQQGKFIVSIDSLGNLSSAKELADIAKGKDAADMGLKAKALKSMMRNVTQKAQTSRTTILFTNHTYDDPSALFPKMQKNMSGGSGPLYMSSCVVQLSRKEEKHNKDNENDEVIPEANMYSGFTLGMLTTKNRFVPPFLKQEAYLNYKTGLDTYSGLKDMAVAHGVIMQDGSRNSLPDGTKLGYYKTWSQKREIWDYILPKLEEKIKAAYKFGS